MVHTTAIKQKRGDVVTTISEGIQITMTNRTMIDMKNTACTTVIGNTIIKARNKTRFTLQGEGKFWFIGSE